VFKKNISDGVGSPNGSNGTPLDPPLYWLDNIFNLTKFDSLDMNTVELFYPKLTARIMKKMHVYSIMRTVKTLEPVPLFI
jgi:hypothetical protein